MSPILLSTRRTQANKDGPAPEDIALGTAADPIAIARPHAASALRKCTYILSWLFFTAMLPLDSSIAQPARMLNETMTRWDLEACKATPSMPIVVVAPQSCVYPSVYPIADDTTDTMKVGAPLQGALMGATVGVVTGLVLYEVVDAQLDIGICSEENPNCEVNRNYSRPGMALVFGAIGAGIGWAVGKSVSRRDSSYDRFGKLPPSRRLKIVPHFLSRPALQVTYRY